MLTVNDMLNEMANAPKSSVQVYKSEYATAGWSCTIESNDGEGTALKIRKEARDPDLAVRVCYEAYCRAIEKGVSQLSPKLLTARPNKPDFTPPATDDGITF